MTDLNSRPTSITIFLATGTPDGIRVVEKANWTGKAVVAGRSQLKEALRRRELAGPGVYILTGPGSGIARRIYIGESDTLATRLNQHHSREFWTQFVAFTSTNEGLNKASIRYLETRLVNLAREANQWEVENGPVSEEPVLSEVDRANAEWFLGEMLQIYPILGVDAFESASREPSASDDSELLFLSERGAEARGREASDGFVVLQGSKGRLAEVNSISSYDHDLRQELINRDVLRPDGESLIFTQDYRFSSPSQASSVLVGGSSNGRMAWRNGGGVTLKEIQDGRGGELA